MITKYILVFLISMLPLVELRGAIPYAQVVGVPFRYALPLAVVGNLIPMPFIFFFARKILKWGSDKPVIGRLFSAVLRKGHAAGEKLRQGGAAKVYLALLFFIMIPVPGTGAWTGILAASILDLNFKKSMLAAFLGVLGASLIMALASRGLFHIFT